VDLLHYQEVSAKFVSALDSYDERMVVYLYLPGKHYKNHFLTVQNSLERVKPFVDWTDWMEVSVACCPKKKVSKHLSEKK
jgi:hypothetical protein